MFERHLQKMITPWRLKQALTWWMTKHADSGRKLASFIKVRCGHLIHLFQQSILRNTYKISPSFRVVNTKGDVFEIWQDTDRVVHYLLAETVRSAFHTVISPKCIHVKRHGGMKHHLYRLKRALERYPYVYRTDIKRFYASIPHKALMRMLRSRIDDPVILRLIYETISAPIWVEGKLQSRKGKGIPLTCPLSPLIGAIYLSSIDRMFDHCSDVFYVRFMDDIIVLTKNHKRLENVVAMARAEMNVLKVAPHPKKTFVGKTIRGFSFLGFDFGVALKPPKKEGDRPIRQVTQKVRSSTLRRCYRRAFSFIRMGTLEPV